MSDEVNQNEQAYGWEPIFGSSIREAYYDVIDKVPNHKWNEFARIGLRLEEPEIEDIAEDNRHNAREKKYQMCRKWGQLESVDDSIIADEKHLEVVTAAKQYLYRILNHFMMRNTHPNLERVKSTNRRRLSGSYCYRVGKVEISDQKRSSENFLSIYKSTKGTKEAVIFNNTFTNSDKFYPRSGTEHDVSNMIKLWEGLGCKVAVHEDFTAYDMMSKLKQYAREWIGVDYCVVIIMSHGDKDDVIYGESYKAEDFVYVSDVTDAFNTTNAPDLAGIPKLFFLQCSRGCKVGGKKLFEGDEAAERPAPIDSLLFDMENQFVATRSRTRNLRHRGRTAMSVSSSTKPILNTQQESEIHSDSNPYVPPLSDMLVCFATTPGSSSFRDPRNGSWFINAITNVFMQHAIDQHVVSLMTKVGEAMLERRALEKHVENQKCVSHFECTLTKQLYLTTRIPAVVSLAQDRHAYSLSSEKVRILTDAKSTQTMLEELSPDANPANEADDTKVKADDKNSLTTFKLNILIALLVLLIGIIIAWKRW